ncbi:Alanyl-tRNA editing protein AlaX-M [Candidatus Bilamarchaeum dharawalense]|uniref:Alanyl-tRNA editing protein AlaX-M n=1 Tax=Candidatus Bilamarchaeum dharawalense TaxID=2885759 RepID=A0A5E4LRA8_9ARCH|nr:Alanyl-tRNA editing protein AlaX-M [Candidatus Bilamarchaeum dharawalense]
MEALYLENSYLKECEATVVAVTGKDIVLDKNLFYPRGGGQPNDTGKVISDSGQEFKVVMVMKKDGQIIHELETESSGLVVGANVKCILDWPRRYKLMRMHTAAHVLGSVMYKELGVLISGNQLEEDKTRFDFTMAEFDRNVFEKVVEKANQELLKDVELKIYSLPRDDAMKIEGVVKLAGALPPSITTLRIVEIPGIDIQADGGTHIKNLKEVGQISILRLDNKGKENRRIYFTLNE